MRSILGLSGTTPLLKFASDRFLAVIVVLQSNLFFLCSATRHSQIIVYCANRCYDATGKYLFLTCTSWLRHGV